MERGEFEFTWLHMSWEGHEIQGTRETGMRKSRNVESECLV